MLRRNSDVCRPAAQKERDACRWRHDNQCPLSRHSFGIGNLISHVFAGLHFIGIQRYIYNKIHCLIEKLRVRLVRIDQNNSLAIITTGSQRTALKYNAVSMGTL